MPNPDTTEHTPGPWFVWDRGIGWAVHHGERREDGSGWPVNGQFRETFKKADANLIAAAPDLLAVLRRLVQLADDNPHCQVGLAIAPSACAAIAKAETGLNVPATT